MNSLVQLFLANIKIIYRDKGGLFWNLVVPVGLYVALSVLPIPKMGNNLSYKDYVLPGIIAYTIMTGGIYSLGYWMVDMRTRGVIKRFLVTPLKNYQLILSLLAARLAVIIFQVIFLTLIGALFFHARFVGNIMSTLLFVILGGGIFLIVGLLISSVADTYQSAAPLTAAIGMPSAFLGNIFFPIEGLPKVLYIIAKILPITYLSGGLRNVYLYPFNIHLIGNDLLIVAAWFIGLLILTISVFRLKE